VKTQNEKEKSALNIKAIFHLGKMHLFSALDFPHHGIPRGGKPSVQPHSLSSFRTFMETNKGRAKCPGNYPVNQSSI